MLSILRLKHFNSSIMLSQKYYSLRIGCSSGFWGDTAVAAPQLISSGQIDFLVMDYLSEITMSLLAKAKSLDSTKGFTPDFINIGRYGKELKQQGIRVVANAGGINPNSCYEELKKSFKKAGVEMKIAIVTGDDLMSKPDLHDNLETSNGQGKPQGSLMSSNVYFGASPIQQALDRGADVVVTGRCVDSAITLGPLMHHFKWKDSELDKLAAGSLAGHLIECGAQVTGGIFTDCFSVEDWWNIGFPIVDVKEDGVFSVTKPHNTGGLVSVATVSEQLVYEIGDPASYILPDVVCDFRNVTLKQITDNEVEVRGAKGIAPTSYFKVSSTYLDNHRLTVIATIVGKDAVSKGRLTAEQIIKRVQFMLKRLNIPDFTRINIQIIGGEDCYGPSKNIEVTETVREAVIYIAAEHSSTKALQILAMEIAPAGTGMAPGLIGLGSGRPKISPILRLHSSFIKKNKINATVKINDEEISVPFEIKTLQQNMFEVKKANNERQQTYKLHSHEKRYVLRELAYARSGDKGDACNIGVIARHDDAWLIIKERLSVEVVGQYFNHFFRNRNWIGNIERFELPGIKALNFVLNNSLDGGGVSSLRVDAQGKAYAQMLLDVVI